MKRGPDRLPLALAAIGYHENQNVFVSNTRFLLQIPAVAATMPIEVMEEIAREGWIGLG
jgi:hypothetical protein